METEIISLVQNTAFPIVVTLWFMFRTEKVISMNTEVTNQLKEEIIQFKNANK